MTDVVLPARPNSNANKATWVSYLAAHGMQVEAARGLSKPQMFAEADRIEAARVQKVNTSEPLAQEVDGGNVNGNPNVVPENNLRQGDIVDAEVVSAEEAVDVALSAVQEAREAVAEARQALKEDVPDNPDPSDPGVPVNSRRGGYLNIQDAILEVMKVVGAIGKSELNRTPGASYNFRGVDTVIKAVSPAFKMFGVTISPEVVSVNTSRAPKDTNNGGVLLWADVVMKYTLTARDGTTRVWSAPGAAMDSGDKAIGKACSVAYRIAMLQGLCIPTDEPDPDSVSYGTDDDGYQTHGRGSDTRQQGNARQQDAQPQQSRPDYGGPVQPTQADKIREYTMNVLKEYDMNGRQIAQAYADRFKGEDWFKCVDEDRLKSFGADMRDAAIQDRAHEEAEAVANVIGGLGGTVVEEPDAEQ